MEAPAMFNDVGIKLSASEMPNGEKRYRIMFPDGSGYIRTVAGANGAWQNAHYHAGVFETYTIQSGWMGFAESDNNAVIVGVYRAGNVVTSSPTKEHNVYLPARAVIHTVKHGVEVPNPVKGTDWYDARDVFDQWTKSLSESDIQSLDGKLQLLP